MSNFAMGYKHVKRLGDLAEGIFNPRMSFSDEAIRGSEYSRFESPLWPHLVVIPAGVSAEELRRHAQDLQQRTQLARDQIWEAQKEEIEARFQLELAAYEARQEARRIADRNARWKSQLFVLAAVSWPLAPAALTTEGGTAVAGRFIVEEAVEYGFEQATGVPVLTDPSDLIDLARRRLTRSSDEVADVVGGTVRTGPTGGRTYADLSPDDWTAAERGYAALRGTTDDIDDILANTTLKRHQVERVKDHLFNRAHQLDSGTKRFDADPLILDAWNRLRRGEHTADDLRLFKHERVESIIEQLYQVPYRRAHDAADRRYQSGLGE